LCIPLSLHAWDGYPFNTCSDALHICKESWLGGNNAVCGGSATDVNAGRWRHREKLYHKATMDIWLDQPSSKTDEEKALLENELKVTHEVSVVFSALRLSQRNILNLCIDSTVKHAMHGLSNEI
jgi:hypothetical protein